MTHSATDDARLPGRRALRILQWGVDLGMSDVQLLGIGLGERPASLAGSTATGEALVSNGHLGADIIRLAAGERFAPHTHPGDHLLIVIGGQGTITYDGVIHPTRAGEIYLVAGEAPHAVGAITDHVILAVGSPHLPVDSPERMTPAAYQAVTSEVNDLHCLICDRRARLPRRLHELGCSHCPCDACHVR